MDGNEWSASRFSIDELADNLRVALDSHSVFLSHKEVVFISHSMGGLVVRAFLLKYQSLKYPAQVPMIYFLATPTTGSELAQLAKLLLVRNPQISDLLPWRDASDVGNLVRNWNAAKFGVRSYCAYEKQDDLFFAARALYRLDAQGGTARQVDLNGIRNARALAITPRRVCDRSGQARGDRIPCRGARRGPRGNER
jgi:pimeloyl-ACP methyl ester carboxylesterase